MRKILIMVAALILSGCATTGTTPGSSRTACDPNDKNSSFFTKMQCDLGGGYAASVNEREQSLVAARDENQQFAQIYQQITAQQKNTRASLAQQQRRNQQLSQSLQQLLGQVQAKHGHKSQVQQQISQVKKQMQQTQQGASSSDPAAMVRKQEELRVLQQQLQRLQLSLGYE